MNIPLVHEVLVEEGNDGAAYILDMDKSCDGNSLGVVSAGINNTVSVHDIASGSCIFQSDVEHSQVMNSICYSLSSPSIIVTTAEDMTTRLFDCRTSRMPVSSLKLASDTYSAAIGYDDSLLAIANGSEISFFDARNTNSALGSYSDCHSDSILTVKFNPLQPAFLHSSGEDGLLCTYNTSASAEEDAVVSICNVECPVRRVGFFGNGLEGVYALSTIETASCWHYPSSQRIGVFDSIREDLNVNNIIDFWGSDSDPNALFGLAGCNDGSAKVCSIDPSGILPLGNLPKWSSDSPYGHADMIRCCKVFGKELLASGGDDGKICFWRLGGDERVKKVNSLECGEGGNVSKKRRL